jgi:E3 ubiquitin-protein ligase RNF38/44
MLIFYVHLGNNMTGLSQLIPFVLFFAVLFSSQLLEAGVGSALTSAVNNTAEIFRFRTVQIVFWSVFITVMAAMLSQESIRRRLGLGPMGNWVEQQAGARRRPRNAAERMNFITSVIQSLPLEKYMTREDLKKCSISELKERIHELQKGKNKGEAANLDLDTVIEKDELIEAICRSSNVNSSSSTCIICCEDYESGDTLRVLNCGHKFHLECIDRWFLSSTDYSRPAACPMCNTELSRD